MQKNNFATVTQQKNYFIKENYNLRVTNKQVWRTPDRLFIEKKNNGTIQKKRKEKKRNVLHDNKQKNSLIIIIQYKLKTNVNVCVHSLFQYKKFYVQIYIYKVRNLN